jgi:hypothetical protein
VTVPGPNFSPVPFHHLRRLSRRDAAIESTLARWLAPRQLAAKVAALAGGPVRARLVGLVLGAPDPYAALAEVRVDGVPIVLAASPAPVRSLAQRLLGGPVELEAPRPLTVVEHAIWALAVAAALTDLEIAAEVWPLTGAPPARFSEPGAITAAFTVELPPELAPPVMTVTAHFAPAILLRAPAPRALHAWRLDLPIVVGRCALPRAAIAGLAARDVITIEPRLELLVGRGGIGLAAEPGALEARVATEYVPRDMALVDDASLELTVQLGTTRLSLRQLGELAIGQVVPLGRPLAGPYEVRAAGRVLGHGELVDIDGELGVRIVSIAPE